MILKDYINVIQNATLFNSFTTEDLTDLFSTIPYKIEKYSKGDIILAEEDTCSTLNLILDGTIEIQKMDSTGKVLSIAEFTEGDIFGEMLLFADMNSSPINAISKTKSVVLQIGKNSVLSLCRNKESFLSEYLRIISNKAMILNLKLKEVTLKTIRQKICEYILNQYKHQKTLTINLNMTKKDWADKLGVQRPSLSRELIKMKDEGLINYDKDIIIIEDIESLYEFV